MNSRSDVWQLQTAKNRFSEVVERARSRGPQIVTRHGREAVVVVGVEDYRELTGQGRSRRSLVECLLAAPRVPGGLVVERDRGTGRAVDVR
jgi:prevent-host-death family protein